MILVAVSPAVVIPRVVREHLALAEQESLRLEKETETPVIVQKDFQNRLKKEKEVETDHLEKDHPIHFNPARRAHHDLARNLFKKERKEPEVKDLIRKENQVLSNHAQTDHQVSARNLSQSVKVAEMKSHSEEAAVLMDHGQAVRHDSKRNHLIVMRKEARDHLKTGIPVHSIHAAQDQKDQTASPKSHLQNLKKVVTKNHLRKPSPIHSIQTQVTSRVKRNHFKNEMLKAVKEKST